MRLSSASAPFGSVSSGSVAAVTNAGAQLAQDWQRVVHKRMVFDTPERDCAEQTVGRIFRSHTLTPQGDAPLRARMQLYDTGTVSLCELSYGDTVQIAPGALENFYLLQIPLAGEAWIDNEHERFVSNAHVASLLSPQPRVHMQWAAGNQQICIRIEAAKMQRFLHTWTGHAPARLPKFQGRIAWHEHPSLWRTLRCVVQQQLTAHDQASRCQVQGSVASQVELQLMATLLSTVPHDCMALLHSTTPPLTPRSVRLVEDYIVHHCDQAVSPEQLAGVAHVSVRSLYLGFQRYRGISPMRFLHEVRLQKARIDLLCASPDAHISDIALRWQLQHLGRFASDYRKAYGESPKATLAQARW